MCHFIIFVTFVGDVDYMNRESCNVGASVEDMYTYCHLIRCIPCIFLSHMFVYVYVIDDVNGDGELDREECKNLVREMLNEQHKFGEPNPSFPFLFPSDTTLAILTTTMLLTVVLVVGFFAL
jgi:hypothetical protein